MGEERSPEDNLAWVDPAARDCVLSSQLRLLRRRFYLSQQELVQLALYLRLDERPELPVRVSASRFELRQEVASCQDNRLRGLLIKPGRLRGSLRRTSSRKASLTSDRRVRTGHGSGRRRWPCSPSPARRSPARSARGGPSPSPAPRRPAL